MTMQPVRTYDQDQYPDLQAHYQAKGVPLSAALFAAMLAALAVLMQGCGGPS